MIRLATRYDIAKAVEMMRQYAAEAPIKKLNKPDVQDEKYVSELLFSLILGKGFVLIDNEFRGMICGIVTPNIWCPKVLELRELAWWVKPEFRNTSLGGKLWVEFNKKAQSMLDENKIDIVCSTVMSTSPSLNYEKRGFSKLETTYFRE